MPTSAELVKEMPDMFLRATKAGMSVSAYLEKLDPSSDERHKGSKTDAFGRILREMEIRTRSNPAAGVWASELGEFDESAETRAALLEWANRQYRSAKYGQTANTRAISVSDELLGSALRPYTDAAGVRFDQFQPEVPLSALVAVETPVTGMSYRATFLDDAAFDNVSYSRVEELAEIPMASLKTAAEDTRLHKYGRGIEWSYESMREQRIDKVALFIAELALRSEEQKTAFVVNLLVNGDGNPDTAADVIDSTTLDPASTTAPTLQAFLGFKKSFRPPYRPTIMLGLAASVTALEMMPIGTTNVPFVTLPANAAIGRLTPIGENNSNVDLAYGTVTAGIPASSLLAIDDRFALERVSQIGSRVSEADKFITRQSEVIVFTETEGWKILSKHANKLLTFAS